MDDWLTVELETWPDFFMGLRTVLTELPPGTSLLLGPEDDARVAHIVARPRPHVEVRAHGDTLASLTCRSLSDVLDHVRGNIEDHWELDSPAQLAYAYDGDVSPRLRRALTSADVVRELPEGERPSTTAHTAGEDGDSGLAGRLDGDVAEKLRRMGSSAVE